MWIFSPIYTLAFYQNLLPITRLPTWNPHKIWLSPISLSLTRLPWPPWPKPYVLLCARVLLLATNISITLRCACPRSFPVGSPIFIMVQTSPFCWFDQVPLWVSSRQDLKLLIRPSSRASLWGTCLLLLVGPLPFFMSHLSLF